MGTLGIVLSLYAATLRGHMQYRVNFISFVVLGIFWQASTFAFIWVVLTRFPALAGWTMGEVAFLYGIRAVGYGLYWFLFFGEMGLVQGNKILSGDFDRYLVRPLHPLLQVVSARIDGGYGDLIFGIALLAAATASVGIDWTPLAVVYLLLAILGAALIQASIQIVVGALAFRFLETSGVSFATDSVFANFGGYPLAIYGRAMELILTFGLPVAFIAYVPASTLLGRTGELAVPPVFAYLAPLAGAIWLTLAILFWQSQMRRYQSAGH